MKKFFIVFILLFPCFVFTKNRAEKRIELIAAPYQEVIDFIRGLETVRVVHDHDVYMFFNKYGFYKKKELRKLYKAVNLIKKLTYTKRSLREKRNELELLIACLDKVVVFTQQHAITYNVLITYYDIAALYYYIDEHHNAIVDLLVQQSNKLGLSNMHGRGLYKFVKKIDLDLRRLTALFIQNIISDDLMSKINQLKTKLVILKNKIMATCQYKSQLRKTRCLKAIGVITLFASGSAVAALVNSVWGIAIAITPLIFVQAGIAIHELRQASKYNIPVHSSSLFSWFTPQLFLLTWVPRG